ncbi:MAG: prolyl oligopeptidase family serine peptidase [Gemmatimonadaceae bacterium]|nr:prolyl oligopeptidase family serine peptidase [Gemmatimonadaceae bacterium]
MRLLTRTLVRAAVVVAAAPALLLAQAGDPWTILRAESWQKPAAHIERMVMTPRTDISFDAMSPDGRFAMRLTGPGRGAIAQYGAPHLWLGGLQVDHLANRARALTTAQHTGISLADPRTGQVRALQTPAGERVSGAVWSPDGSKIAFLGHTATATHLYVADVRTGRFTRLTRTPLLATLVTEPRFTPDGRHLIVVLPPANRGPVPVRGNAGVADGPQVRFTESIKKPQRVHFSLLEDPHDKNLYTYYTRGQLALVDVSSGNTRSVGAPGLIRSADASPDGRYLRVTRTVEPFSYIVPHNQFGTVTELWDATGRVIATLATQPLREGAIDDDAPRGPAAPDTSRRNFAWHPEGGLTYLRTTLGSDNRANGVRWMHWKAPFGEGDTALVFAGSARFTSAAWGSQPGTIFVNDSGAVAALRLADLTKKYPLGRGVTLPGGGFGGFGGGGFGGGAQMDTVGTGGALQTTRAADGGMRVQMSRDGSGVYVSGVRRYGNEWHRRAPRPWLDRINIEDASRRRLLDSPADVYESFVTALDADFTQVVVTRQSATMIEDAYLRDLGANTERKLTAAVDVGPEITGAVRKRVQVTRPRDGTDIWVDVVLPRGWQPGRRMPGVIWFYPREYATVEAYQRSKWNTNINSFPAVPPLRPASSTELWVAGGYALITPDIPIFGDSGRMNDNYVRDLTENLAAVVNAMVDSGFVDRNQMGIGGHSYGAFSTVNAMTRMDIFKAGIAGDGMYNRTLTPFGFQSERRNFWEAQSMYLDLSALLRADQLSGALLLYHATEDQNVGTHPMSSIKMHQALQGLGKTSALFMYPYEDHSVATYESDLDMWARWIAWFDVYVKAGGTAR